LFYSAGTSSLSVKKLSIYNSFGNISVFRFESSGTLSVDSVNIKSFSDYTVGIFYINSTGNCEIKSSVVADVNLIDKAIFEFDNNIKPSRFTIDKCIFNNINRTGGYGGAIINIFNLGNSQTYVKGCSFTSVSSFGNGGALYVDISSGGTFIVENSSDSTSNGTSFSSCSAGSGNGKGGGMYVKLGSITSGFSFSGGLSFANCKASKGNNIYIESVNLNNVVWSNTFNYNYDSSLLLNTNEVFGGV
jgi:hypothetical protein